MTGPGRTTTERLSNRDHDRANAAATAYSANDATATRPDAACSDTRQDTKPQAPARNADHTTDEKDGSQEDEATMYLPMRSNKATAQRRSQANVTRPAAARPKAPAHAPLNLIHSGAEAEELAR